MDGTGRDGVIHRHVLVHYSKFEANVAGTETHEKHTFGFVTAVTARKKNTEMNFHQREHTCVVPPRMLPP